MSRPDDHGRFGVEGGRAAAADGATHKIRTGVELCRFDGFCLLFALFRDADVEQHLEEW